MKLGKTRAMFIFHEKWNLPPTTTLHLRRRSPIQASVCNMSRYDLQCHFLQLVGFAASTNAAYQCPRVFAKLLICSNPFQIIQSWLVKKRKTVAQLCTTHALLYLVCKLSLTSLLLVSDHQQGRLPWRKLQSVRKGDVRMILQKEVWSTGITGT